MWVQLNAALLCGYDIDASWVFKCSCLRRVILLCAILVFSLGCPAYELSNSLELFLLSELWYFQSAGPWGSIAPLKHLYHPILPCFFCSRWSPYTAQLEMVAVGPVPLHVHFAITTLRSISPTEHPENVRIAFHISLGPY